MKTKKNTFTEFHCSNCGKLSLKKNSAYNYNLKHSGNNFCSLGCSSSFNGKKDPNRKEHLAKCRIKGLLVRKSTFTATAILKCAKNNIRNRIGEKLEFNITRAYLKELWESQKGMCPYTNIQLVLPTIYETIKDITIRASLDRIDSSKGYIKGNVQFISTAINYMKSTMTNEETINFINLIVSNKNKESQLKIN